MALIDKLSQYGPTNTYGQKGTGTTIDTLAFETGKGITGAVSKYGPISYGKQPTRYEDTI